MRSRPTRRAVTVSSRLNDKGDAVPGGAADDPNACRLHDSRLDGIDEKCSLRVSVALIHLRQASKRGIGTETSDRTKRNKTRWSAATKSIRGRVEYA